MPNFEKSKESKFNSNFFCLRYLLSNPHLLFFSSFNSFSNLSFSPALVGYTTKTPLNPKVTGFTIFSLSYFS